MSKPCCNICESETDLMHDTKLYISWSALRSWEECKVKFKLRRKKNPAANIRGYFHGTVADRVMRDALNDPDYQPGDMYRAVEDKVNEEALKAIETGDGVVRWKHANDREEMIGFVGEMVQRLEPILAEHVWPYPYEPAKRFTVPIVIPGLRGEEVIIWLAGEFDIVTKPDKFVVWDLKGTADNSYWRKTFGQLVFYDLAVEAMYGQGPTEKVGLFQPMCDERVKEWVLTEQQRAELMQRIIRMAHAIWKGDYSMTNVKDEPVKGYVCDGCFVRHACPKFQPVSLDPERRISLTDMGRLTSESVIERVLQDPEA